MTTAVSSDAAMRATTIRGAPGNATAVATRTTGLIAGAASMNVNAAAPVTPPSPNNLRANGTDPHSQPGSATPPTPAATTATAGRRGSQRANRWGDTNTAITPLTTTPSTRKGIACTKTPQNTVPTVDRAALLKTALRRAVAATAQANRMATSTSIEPGRNLRPDFSVSTRAIISAPTNRQPEDQSLRPRRRPGFQDYCSSPSLGGAAPPGPQ